MIVCQLECVCVCVFACVLQALGALNKKDMCVLYIYIYIYSIHLVVLVDRYWTIYCKCNIIKTVYGTYIDINMPMVFVMLHNILWASLCPLTNNSNTCVRQILGCIAV